MSLFSRLTKRSSGKPPQPPIVADALKGAEWIAKALNSSGYRADFSLESLREVDRYFDDQTLDGKARDEGLLSQKLGQRLFALGAYCGEVIRRGAGGTWQGGTPGPQAEIDLALLLLNGSTLYPVQRAMKRYQNGTEDSLYAYAAVIMRSA